MDTKNEQVNYAGDLHFLAVSMMRFRMEASHVAVLTFLFRNGATEAMELVEDTQLSKSSAFRLLHYLQDKGAVRHRYRKDADRQVVRLWELTEDGRRSVLEMERWYRRYQQRCIRHAMIQGGDMV